MTPDRIFNIYFSATGTTQHYAETLASYFDPESKSSVNIADNPAIDPIPDSNDLVIIAAPVYGGRLPQSVASYLKRLKGNNAAAIAVAVYGNRDFDDALIELTDILQSCQFRILGAGAFIGQHSIFPKAGASRPDHADLLALERFGLECRQAMTESRYGNLAVPGNKPYKKIAGVPLHPGADRKLCRSCGKCATNCPAGAINLATPYLTDNDKCISCGRCIAVCATNARRYSGVKYRIVNRLFVSAFSRRKEPEWFIAGQNS